MGGNSAEVIRQVKATASTSFFPISCSTTGAKASSSLKSCVTPSDPAGHGLYDHHQRRGYTNVVALAELAPDDYLIKPFTAEQLQARLVKAIYKKHVLRRIYEQVERAPAGSDGRLRRVIQQQPVYM